MMGMGMPVALCIPILMSLGYTFLLFPTETLSSIQGAQPSVSKEEAGLSFSRRGAW